MKRFENYKQEVILAYEEKKRKGELPPNLQRLTTANLKNECLAVFFNRYTKNDNETFKSLYAEEKNSAEEYFKMVQVNTADPFKPLYNFLKGKTDDTKDRNIELLAWLIDFQPRPHRPADIYELVKSELDASTTTTKPMIVASEDPQEATAALEATEIEILTEPTDHEIIAEEKELPASALAPLDDLQKVNDKNFGIPRKFNKAVIAFFAALIILCGSYIFYDQSKQQCMYWDGDQFQSVACDQKVDGATIIALNTSRLVHLKRIKNTTEITRNDIGKVHYSKVNGKVEFYTTGGENPTDSRKRLLPMTEYMYNSYVEQQQP